MNRIFIFLALVFLSFVQTMAQEAKIEGIIYKVIAPGEVEVSDGRNIVGDIVIPAAVTIKKQTYKVVGIESYSFYPTKVSSRGSNSRLTGITLSDNIRYIGKNAFCGCDKLQTVVFSKGIEQIDEGAFMGCKILKDVKLPLNLRKIGMYAFYNCDLQEIEIPNTVDSIGDECFACNYELKKVILPQRPITFFYDLKSTVSRKQIFYKCKKLESVIASNNVMRFFENHFDKDCPFMTKYRATTMKSFSYYAFDKATKRLEDWQKKTEYETMEQWRARVTEKTREKKLATVLEDLRNEYINQNAAKTINGNLGTYNADDGVYPVIINGLNEEVFVQVPISEAPNFKQKWNEVTIVPKYGIVDDQIAVLSYSFQLGGKKYASTQNYTNDNFSDLAIDLPPLEMDFGSVNDKVPSVAQQKPVRKEIEKRDYSMDRQIPETNVNNAKTFAVIIGNENYQRVTKVDFANNDAKIFAAYCHKTLGLPTQNIRSYNDATYASMMTALKDIAQIAEAYKGDINVIFYYAGHGVPNESTHEAFLLPVDVDGSQTDLCLSVGKLYKELNAMNANKVVVFMDACFSGSQRGDGMLASARGVALKVKNDSPMGNMVVLTAATEDQTAYPYKEKGHGMFTYFLLKKLQETKGEANLGELADYITEQVSQQSVVINRKMQTPTTLASPDIVNDWKSLKLK